MRVTFTGLAGDEQADRAHHGGLEKVLHFYPLDHYPYWYGYLRAPLMSLPAGAFGENLSTYGLTESDVCIGDAFKLGSGVIQITQPRQPCWKLNVRFGTQTRQIVSRTYSSLVMAVGSESIRIPNTSSESRLTWAVNDLNDHGNFHRAISGKKRIVIIGEGRVGCEFANDLALTGYEVDVVDPGA